MISPTQLVHQVVRRVDADAVVVLNITHYHKKQ